MSAPTATGLSWAPSISGGGAPLPDSELTRLARLSLNQALRLPARVELEFDDPGYVVSSASWVRPGASLEVGFGDGGPVFHGTVTAVGVRVSRGLPQLRVTADDDLYLLTLNAKVRNFTGMSYADVAGSIAQAYGLLSNVDGLPRQFDYLLQYDSDYGLLCDLADRAGMDFWVQDRTLHVRRPGSGTALDLKHGDTLLEFSAQASLLHTGQVTVNGWDPVAKAALSVTRSEDSSDGGNLVSGFRGARGSGKVVSGGWSPLNSAEAQELAASAAAFGAGAAVRARGLALGDSRIAPGVTVRVGDCGSISGGYLVTEAVHQFDAAGFRTRFVTGGRRPAGLVDSLAGPRPGSFRQDRLVIGIVTQIQEHEKSGPGAVKVKFPGVSDELESGWARLVTIGGGSARGVSFVPEINDEVVVGFENGDPRRPLVLGGVFGAKASAPKYELESGQVKARSIASRLGHALTLSDGGAPADQFISMSLAGGQHQVVLGKTGLTAQVPGGVPVEISAGPTKFQISDDGSITITGKKITLKADSDVEISGMNVTVKATAKVSVQGAQAELKGTAQTTVSASGPVSVKGAVVQVG